MTLEQFHDLQVGDRFGDVIHPGEFHWYVWRRADTNHVLKTSYGPKSNGVIEIAWDSWPNNPLWQPYRAPLIVEEW